MPDASDARFKLTPAQQRIYAALVRHRAELGEWYRAAITVINDPELPDRLSLAAHSLREVMEKLPGEQMKRGPELAAKIDKLRQPWTRACEAHGRGVGWNGAISDPLRQFLDAMQAFFEAQARLADNTYDYVNRFLTRVDGEPKVPTDLLEDRARRWMRLHGYFKQVAHHKPVDEKEFRATIAGFEVFIADQLSRPTDDFAAIDALLEED